VTFGPEIFAGDFRLGFGDPLAPSGQKAHAAQAPSIFLTQESNFSFIFLRKQVEYCILSYMSKKTPKHPGEYIEKIRPGILHLPKTKLAEKLGVSPNTLYAVLRGKRRIDPKMASKLGELHRDARFWIELQAAFDVHQVKSR
jgi:addiction module HigA family antidote